MDKAIVNTLAVVQWLWWPISKLIGALRFLLSPVLHAVLFILSPIAIVAGFLLLPFIHLAKGLFYLVTLPLQVKWLERIEVSSCMNTGLAASAKINQTLYIYLGTAGLIGCMTGAVLYFIASFLSSSLSI